MWSVTWDFQSSVPIEALLCRSHLYVQSPGLHVEIMSRGLGEGGGGGGMGWGRTNLAGGGGGVFVF